MDKKGLFITFEGLSPTISDSQIVTHIQEMKHNGIDIELWAFAPKKKIYASSLSRLRDVQERSGITVRLFRCVPVIAPLSELMNAILLAILLYKHAPRITFIHARTDYSAAVAVFLKCLFRFFLIWDCRGDAEAEYLSRYSQTTIARRYAAPLQKRIIRFRTLLATTFCDHAIFVSNCLRDKFTSARVLAKSTVIPCVASSTIFNFSLELRRDFRYQLGISDNDILVIYSGSMGGYQIFDKCVSMFKRMKESERSLKFLVLTPYLDQAAVFLKSIPADMYLLMKVPFNEVNGYLNAADFGMFLRERDPLNQVASPVKFAEYCLAGLPVIMTDAVNQCVEFAKILGNGIMSELDETPNITARYSDDRRFEIAHRAGVILSRQSMTAKYVALYMQAFVK